MNDRLQRPTKKAKPRTAPGPLILGKKDTRNRPHPKRYGQAAQAVRSMAIKLPTVDPRAAGGRAGAARGATARTRRGGRARRVLQPDRRSAQVRAPSTRTPSEPAVTPQRLYNYQDGSSLISHVHPNAASYKRAVANSERVDAPVAEGMVWHSEPADELEEIKRDGRHLRISGREFLAQVYVLYDVGATSSLSGVGERVLCRPLSPEGIGGRIQRLAELYESHRSLSMAITYAPVVPTTTAGALAMAFVNDPALSQHLTGIQEMVHLSNAADFIQFPVWKSAQLHVDPDRFTRELADEQEGDARFTTDGLLIMLLAGPISNPGPGSLVFGNLFIEYEYEFTAPLLDQDVATPATGSVVITAGPATNTVIGAAYAALGPVAGGFPLLTMVGVAIADSPDYVYTLTLQALTVTTSLPMLRALDTVTQFQFTVGQSFFMRCAVSASGTDCFGFLFDSLEAASNFVFDQGSPSGAVIAGQIVHAASSAAGTHQYTARFLMSAQDISTSGL